MTNHAWLRLNNEWKANAIVNEYFIDLCNKGNVSTDFPNASQTETCLEIRKQCKANYIWLEDFAEVDEYLEQKPFGRDFNATEIKALAKTFRLARKLRRERVA